MAAALGLPGAAAPAWRWPLPAWAPLPAVPADNPMPVEKIELGRHLFHDRRLPADGSLACASCHQQALVFTDGRAASRGVTGAAGTRSAMCLANVADLPVLTWQNPQLTSLEVQALIPLCGEPPDVVAFVASPTDERFLREPRHGSPWPAPPSPTKTHPASRLQGEYR